MLRMFEASVYSLLGTHTQKRARVCTHNTLRLLQKQIVIMREQADVARSGKTESAWWPNKQLPTHKPDVCVHVVY